MSPQKWFEALPTTKQALVAVAFVFASGFAVRGVVAEVSGLQKRVDALEPKVNYLFCVERYRLRALDTAACEDQLPPELRRLP